MIRAALFDFGGVILSSPVRGVRPLRDGQRAARRASSGGSTPPTRTPTPGPASSAARSTLRRVLATCSPPSPGRWATRCRGPTCSPCSAARCARPWSRPCAAARSGWSPGCSPTTSSSVTARPDRSTERGADPRPVRRDHRVESGRGAQARSPLLRGGLREARGRTGRVRVPRRPRHQPQAGPGAGHDHHQGGRPRRRHRRARVGRRLPPELRSRLWGDAPEGVGDRARWAGTGPGRHRGRHGLHRPRTPRPVPAAALPPCRSGRAGPHRRPAAGASPWSSSSWATGWSSCPATTTAPSAGSTPSRPCPSCGASRGSSRSCRSSSPSAATPGRRRGRGPPARGYPAWLRTPAGAAAAAHPRPARPAGPGCASLLRLGRRSTPASSGTIGGLVVVPVWFLSVYVVVTALGAGVGGRPPAVRRRPPPLALAAVAARRRRRPHRHRPRRRRRGQLLRRLPLRPAARPVVARRSGAPARVAGSRRPGRARGCSPTVGPYPVSMVGVPGEALANNAPPTLCLVVLGLVQVGAGRAAPVRRWSACCTRRPVQVAAIALNRNAMTILLWHFTALVIGALVVLPARRRARAPRRVGGLVGACASPPSPCWRPCWPPSSPSSAAYERAAPVPAVAEHTSRERRAAAADSARLLIATVPAVRRLRRGRRARPQRGRHPSRPAGAGPRPADPGRGAGRLSLRSRARGPPTPERRRADEQSDCSVSPRGQINPDTPDRVRRPADQQER